MKAINSIVQLTGYRAWSYTRHALTAMTMLAASALLLSNMLSQQRDQLLHQRSELVQLQQSLKLQAAQAKPPVSTDPDFTQRWPQRDEINAVVRFIGTLAQQHQVNLGQMTLSHTTSSALATGRVDISLSMNSVYAGGKQVLSELLSRYPSLALQSLSATPRTGDALRIDWTLALTLYVKD